MFLIFNKEFKAMNQNNQLKDSCLNLLKLMSVQFYSLQKTLYFSLYELWWKDLLIN